MKSDNETAFLFVFHSCYAHRVCVASYAPAVNVCVVLNSKEMSCRYNLQGSRAAGKYAEITLQHFLLLLLLINSLLVCAADRVSAACLAHPHTHIHTEKLPSQPKPTEIIQPTRQSHNLF